MSVASSFIKKMDVEYDVLSAFLMISYLSLLIHLKKFLNVVIFHIKTVRLFLTLQKNLGHIFVKLYKITIMHAHINFWMYSLQSFVILFQELLVTLSSSISLIFSYYHHFASVVVISHVLSSPLKLLNRFESYLVWFFLGIICTQFVLRFFICQK